MEVVVVFSVLDQDLECTYIVGLRICIVALECIFAKKTAV